jgi:hypothetical protein
MAIPITCPGCQAGFEVPENLAGKTIRCTSCKTQLTVPAADAKKPFGWAGAAATPAATAAKPAPTRAAVAVDDDEDDLKTSPSRPASKNGPTIKGAIKTSSKRRDDDDDDDDDEDDRPRRGKKAAAAGGGAMLALIGGGILCLGAIVGLAVWLMNDGDSEETASDNTNTPARSTPTGNPSSSDNSGGSGGAGERRDDTNDGGGGRNERGYGGGGMRERGYGGGGGGDNATDSSNAYGGAMGFNRRRSQAGGGTPPAPGGGGAVGAGGGNPFGNFGQFAGDSMGTPGAWAKHDGDGFSVEFPGEPGTREMGAQGMTIKITAVGGKTHPVTGVMLIQLPAAIAQVGSPKQVLDLMLSQSKAQLGGAVPRDVTVSGHPGKEFEVTQQGVSARARMVLAHDRLYMFVAGGGGRTPMPKDDADRFLNSVSISYKGGGGAGRNVAFGGGGASPDAGFTDPRNGGADPRRGGLGTPPTPDAGFTDPRNAGGFGDPRRGGLGTPPTPDAGFSDPRNAGGGFGDPRRGGLGGDTPTAGGFPQPPVGGGFGGAPQPGGFRRPGALGGLQQPGGGLGGFGGGSIDTNPAPFGAQTDGNRKANVEPFFTGVFDPAKKEFFTFSSSRSGRTIATRLNRFDVSKDFAPAGQFKVPSFVTRAVIDPAKGRLYVATVARPTVSALGDQMLDQAVGVGDVQIFDLGQIRDGTVKDGADLKPVATIAFAREIRGLELTPDGSTLVVLSSTSGKTPKSFLSAYDTETRKPAQPPKELSEPAWNSCKSPDGKHLLVIDKVEPGEASMARLYDLSSLTMVKTISLQGGGLDIAATAGGQYAAAVVVNGASKVVLATDKDIRDFDTGLGWKAAAKPGYVEYSSDGKLLFVSGHPGASGSYPRPGQQQVPAGLDVYEVTDPDAAGGIKKKASIRTAGGQMVGGHFVVSPNGDYIVFHTGAVLETANIGGNNGEGTLGGGGPPGPGLGAPGVPGAGLGAPGAGLGAPGGGAPAVGAGAPGLPNSLPLPGDPSATTGGPPRRVVPSIPGGAQPGAGGPPRPPINPSIPGGARPGGGGPPPRPPITPSIPGGGMPPNPPGGIN